MKRIYTKGNEAESLVETFLAPFYKRCYYIERYIYVIDDEDESICRQIIKHVDKEKKYKYQIRFVKFKPNV